MNIFTDITLIYVAHKSDQIIKKNIDIIKLFNTIVVDNSKSIYLEKYLKNFDNIKFISSANFGFGHANNLAVKHARTPYVFIISPDIFFTINSLEILYKQFLLFGNTGVAGPSLFDEKNLRRSNSSLSFIKKKIYRNSFEKKIYNKLCQNQTEGNLSCDYIIGCSMLFKRSFFLEIGGFDERFFIYYEDNDICDRINANNKMVLEVPSSKMIHLQGKSTKSNFITSTLLSIIHKISEYKYLNKNISKYKLSGILILNTLDYSQRFLINLFFLKFRLSYKNLLRLISIFLFITQAYRIVRY
jgi:GT2 family glycosyltransferase